MKDGMDAVTRGARVRRLDRSFRWPGGRHVAVIFNIAYEAWSDGKAPGVGPMGNPLPAGTFDTNALSWGHYGTSRGVERLQRILDRAKVRGSVMTSGVLAERAPASIKALVDAGHEIVAHAYGQEIVPAQLSPEADKENIRRTTELLTQAGGVKPVGWISPRGTPGAETARFLLEAGYDWHGDVFDDDRPYLQDLDNGTLVAIPLTMEINDLPHAMRFGRSPRQFIEMFDDLLAHALDGEDEAVVIDVTAHCHCYGRPAGAWAYEQVVRRVAGRDDVYVARRDEIARHVRATVR